MLKASFHVHIQGDWMDYITYTGFELLDRAAELGFEVIAFTCHDRVVFTKELEAHAKKLGILLMPGAEMNLGGHVLVLNADEDAEKLKTIDDLRKYRKKRGNEIFTIAAHPFFKDKRVCMEDRLYSSLDAMDGIEHSWFYSRLIDWNRKAKLCAEKNNKPYIATSDIHGIKMLENGHVLIDSEKNIPAILKALREHKFKSVAEPQGVFQMWTAFGKMFWDQFKQFFPWSPPFIIFDRNEKFSPKPKRKS
jgi:predicted metal-dependent phosphoesterase TrpH